jgi:hypothetical protein
MHVLLFTKAAILAAFLKTPVLSRTHPPKTPDFSVRNLDGIVDEMIILNATLLSDEIHDIYVVGHVH